MPFAHLHAHSEFSLLDGLSRIPSMVGRAKELGMTALGITDHGSLYGVVDFYSACKEAGVKPVIGCELYVAEGSRFERKPQTRAYTHLTVLAQNNEGYRNLMKLSSKGHLEGFYHKPRVDQELLAEHADGLIVLSGCPSSELSIALIDGRYEQAREIARRNLGTFPAFYLEMQRHENLDFLEPLNNGLLKLGEELDIPIVATNDLHYVHKADSRLHDVLLCIGTNSTVHDEKRFKFDADSFYLKSPEEMAELFEDLPEAVSITQQIADSTDVSLDFSTLHLPQYATPDGEDADAHLRRLCWQGFDARYPNGAPNEHKERLAYELDVITHTQYPNYFLVVWDIAEFARRNDIVFGVRGSAASSLALYCLGVTDIDPLDYRLVFERFLNIERKEMPDIDMDFQDDRREEAIQYVTGKYGRDHVAQIITFGTLGARAAIRDAGRALGMAYADVDRIAQFIPKMPLGITLQEALEASPEMQEAYNGDEAYRNLIDTAQGLEGVTRHASTHAAGVVISQDPLTEHIPLQRPTKGDESGVAMTQYAMEPVAKLGLLKMDFLGLTNYSVLSDTMRLVRERRGIDLRLQDLPFDDAVTYELLASGETAGVFQLEGAGMRRYVKELRPGALGELAAMIALYRPGPMEQIGAFIDSKFGRTPISYPHPALEEILEETYGIIVYQDQVLHVLQRFAGYTLGEADIVRKAMGKKIASLMQEERENFVRGAGERGYDADTAAAVFDLIEPFAGYAFNKAHSVSYAVVAYWTAYFKANYPVEYMTCLLNAYAGGDKVGAYAAECARLDIPILPPDVSRSGVEFSIDTSPEGKQGIRFGLASIKNVGAAAVRDLVAEHVANGPFSSLEDFCRRAGTEAANRRIVESLVKVGALDNFGPRGRMAAGVDSIVHLMQSEARLKDSGQMDMFGESTPTPLSKIELPPAPEPSARELAAWERELLGVSQRQGPLSPKNAPKGAVLSHDELDTLPDGEKALLAGEVASVRMQTDKQGRRVCFAMLEIFDSSKVEIAVWNRVFEQTAELWVKGALLQVKGPVRRRRDEITVHCDEASAYEVPDSPASTDAAQQDADAERWPERETPPVVSVEDEPAPETQAEDAPTPTPPPPATPHANGTSPAPHTNGTSLSSHTNGASPPEEALRRTLLINFTETDSPNDDNKLLRTALQKAMGFQGNDKVDVLIRSQGRRYRLAMPMVYTDICPDLIQELRMLGIAEEALLIEDAPAA